MDQRRLFGIKLVVSINSYVWLLSLNVYVDFIHIYRLPEVVL